MIKISFQTSKDKVLGNNLDFSNGIDRIKPNLVNIVKMLDFYNVNIVKVVIKKKGIFAKHSSVVVTLNTFQDVIDFCQDNEDLTVVYVTKYDNKMRIYTEI